MENKKLILVTGATGAQGGSVVKALLGSGNYAVRALTRNQQSAKAIALLHAGVEVVQGDLNDIESLKAAMQGCYGVFGVTSFWEHFDAEYEQGRNLVNAVKAAGIRHFVLHSLASYYNITGGRYSVPHFDMKAAVQQYTKSLGIPASFVHVAFYYENFLGFLPPQPGDDGSYYFGFPQGDTRFSMASVEDTGAIVKAVFDHPKEYIGRTVGVVGADESCDAYAAIMSKVLGRKIEYRYIPYDEYVGLGFPGAQELGVMFEVQRLYVHNRQLDLIESYGLNPEMQTFEGWVKKNKEAFNKLFRSMEVKTGAYPGE